MKYKKSIGLNDNGFGMISPKYTRWFNYLVEEIKSNMLAVASNEKTVSQPE